MIALFFQISYSFVNGDIQYRLYTHHYNNCINAVHTIYISCINILRVRRTYLWYLNWRARVKSVRTWSLPRAAYRRKKVSTLSFLGWSPPFHFLAGIYPFISWLYPPLHFLAGIYPFISWLYLPFHFLAGIYPCISWLVSALAFLGWYPPLHFLAGIHPCIFWLVSTLSFLGWYPPFHFLAGIYFSSVWRYLAL